MALTDLGTTSIGVAVPGALSACVAGEAGINVVLPDIAARLALVLGFNATVLPPDFNADLSLTTSIAANLTTSIGLGITPPSISAQMSASLDAQATLSALSVAANAQLSILLNLAALLATAGVRLFAFSGNAETLGGELTTALSGDGNPAHALVLLTESGATWTAMQNIFRTA